MFSFFSLLAVLLVFPSVSAIGISPADAYVTFVPGHEYVITYTVSSYKPFEFYTQGRFSEFTRIETLEHTDRHGRFKVYLTLPEEYDTPGKHRMYVAAREKVTPGAVNTVAVIRGFVEVEVPYPGYYAIMDIHVNDVNEDEYIPVTVVVHNKGKLNISDAELELSVLSDGDDVKTIRSEKVPIETNGAYTFQTVIEGGELRPGSYVLDALLSYEGKTRQESEVFRVGTFDVAIVNYTDTMYNNSVNLFEIEVESLWNNEIDTVWMDLSIIEGSRVLSTVKTPPFDLVPWENRKSSFYWNTEGIPVGEYELEIVLHYGEGVKTENRKLYIVEPPVPETAGKLPVGTIVLVVLALVLIGFNVYFIVTKKKDGRDKESKKKSEKKGEEDS